MVPKRPAARVEVGDHGDYVDVAMPVTEHWMARARFVWQADELVISHLEVSPNPPQKVWEQSLSDWPVIDEPSHPQGLSTRTLRAVSLTALSAHVIDVLEEIDEVYGRDFWARPSRRRATIEPRVGRAGHPPEYYAAWARDYVLCLSEAHPIEALAKRRRVSPQRARDVVHTCRTKGFLTPGQRGKPTGLLTPMAVEVLERSGEGAVR
jgi:hypothetical protein